MQLVVFTDCGISPSFSAEQAETLDELTNWLILVHDGVRMLTCSCLTSEPTCLPLCHAGRELGLDCVLCVPEREEEQRRISSKSSLEK